MSIWKNIKIRWYKCSIMWSGGWWSYGRSKRILTIHRKNGINYAMSVGRVGWCFHWWTPTKYLSTGIEADKLKPNPLGRYVSIGLGWISYQRGY